MTKIVAFAATYFAASAAFAQAGCGAKGCVVPEIDALAGVAAIAVVGAAVALFRERAK